MNEFNQKNCTKCAANIMKNNMVQGGKVFFFQFEIPLRGMEFSHLVICGGFNELVIGSVSCRRFIHLCIFHSPQGNLFLLLLRFFPIGNHFVECKVLHAFASIRWLAIGRKRSRLCLEWKKNPQSPCVFPFFIIFAAHFVHFFERTLNSITN